MKDLPQDILDDIEAVQNLSIVPTILDVVCRTTGMGFSAIARVTDENWIACFVKDDINFGLKAGGELKLETTICNEIRQSHTEVAIDNVSEDEQYCGHPTPLMYGFQSYISIPIVLKDGRFFGTLCAIDPKPAKVKNPQIIGMFKLFAELISFHLSSIDQLNATELKLSEERRMSELRDQFIAVLGHDLRNPLGAVSTSSQLLLRMPLEQDALRLATIIKNGSYRMKGLVDNILDFARGRLTGGILLEKVPCTNIEKILLDVISEIAVMHPDRSIDLDYELSNSFDCDGHRIGQLLSNLLGNAIHHGKAGTPIEVRAYTRDKLFSLSVKNKGNKITPVVMDRLFKPFARGEVGPKQQGLGLGLFITHEIATAHGGKIHVHSNDEETEFRFEMPLTD